MKKVDIVFILSVFVSVLFSCKEKKEIFIKKRNFFMPYIHTDIEMEDIDSLVLVKYKNKNIIDSSRKCIRNKFLDNGSAAKWRFMLCDSFEVGYNYKLIFDIDKKKQSYLFTNIVYDTVKIYQGIMYDTKSYEINGVKYINSDCTYTLPDLNNNRK